MFSIVRYESSKKRDWDGFVERSRNATFLFKRDYMDYHADRFEDCSWMAYKGTKLVALLPANITSDSVLHSHQGLTYGGWLLPPSHIDGADVLAIFQSALRQWKSEGINALNYKTIPFIYSGQPSQEDEYALFRLGARLIESNLSAAVDLSLPLRFNKLQRRHLSGTLQLPVVIQQTDDIEGFMLVVDSCLRERHDTSAVHTATEMKLLADRFPLNIKFYTASLEDRVCAAVCVYDTGRVAHAQYIATTDEGRRLNLLTPLFHRLITSEYPACSYFDFGTSCENHGQFLNEGLLRQKYSYGATGVAYNRYILEL